MEHEIWWRMGCFLGILALMLSLETLFPRRTLTSPRPLRWAGNLSVVVLSSVLARVVMPLMPVGLALICAERGWGLLNLLSWPAWLEAGLAILLLDMAVYWQHVAAHKILPLWRLHRMHHIDLDIDSTTALRFHPLEIILSLVWKLIVVLALGPSAWTVIVFEIVLNGCAMFNHANLNLPVGLDNYLRLLMVTPDMHRVHHSVHAGEFSANYGFNFPWWDRMFGSYVAQPADGHLAMKIGLNIFRDRRFQWLHEMLYLPFR